MLLLITEYISVKFLSVVQRLYKKNQGRPVIMPYRVERYFYRE